MYQRIEDLSLHILAAVLIANLLTSVAVWYEIYYVVNDSTTATVKAILVDAAASAALGIYTVSVVDTYMVLSKLILEKYLANRFNDGLERGRQEGRKRTDEEWRAWYERMKEAEERGEAFDELPPGLSAAGPEQR